MIKNIFKYDNEFNEAIFLSYVSNIFVKLYTSLIMKDLRDINHFMSDKVYNKYQNIVNNLIKKHNTNG